MKILNFIKNFWNTKSSVINNENLSIAQEREKEDKLIKDNKPYEFNEFELFFIEAIKSERYDSLDKMLEKGFKINKELRDELYSLFWVDYTYMTREGDNDLTKKRFFDDNKFINFVRFMVKNHLFEMDFFDVINMNDLQLSDDGKETYNAFKKDIVKNNKLMKRHNEIVEESSNNIKHLIIEDVKDVRSFSKLNMYEQNMSSLVSDNIRSLIKHHYALSGLGSDYSNYQLSNKKSNLYKISLTFSKAFASDRVDGFYLNDESFNNFNILKSPLLHIPFIDFLNQSDNLGNIKLEQLKNFTNLAVRYDRAISRFNTSQREEEFGKIINSLYYIGVNKKEMITTLFFPFLIKSMVQNKAVKPIDLFTNIINRDGPISDLAITVFQHYPLEIVGSINKLDGIKLIKKLDIFMLELETDKYLHINAERDLAEIRFIKENLKKDISRLTNLIYKKDEENILYRLDIYNALEVEKTGDFISYAKIKELPPIIIEKLEFISGRLELLKKSDLDIENKLFVEKSSSEIFKILNAYIDLEELSSEMSDIENVLINPLINIDNSLDVIFKNYQEAKMRELSIKKKTAKFS